MKIEKRTSERYIRTYDEDYQIYDATYIVKYIRPSSNLDKKLLAKNMNTAVKYTTTTVLLLYFKMEHGSEF